VASVSKIQFEQKIASKQFDRVPLKAKILILIHKIRLPSLNVKLF